MISPAVIASVVFGACGLLAAAGVEFLMRAMADEAGINRWIFVSVPALFAMFFALVFYQDARRKIKRLGESVSRGILIALMTWISFSLLATMVWCSPKQFGQCLGHTLLAAGIVGGGPMLAAALIGGILTGMIIIRPPSRKGVE